MKVKHLLIALIAAIAIGGLNFAPTTNSVYANTYQTKEVKKQDVSDMINLGADYGFEAIKNMENGDSETAYQNFSKALNYLEKAESYLNQTTDVFDKEKYANSIATTKASISAKMEEIKKTSGTSGKSSTQSSTYSKYYQDFMNDSDIGMKYANKCLDSSSGGNYVEVVKNANIAIEYLTRAMQNLIKDNDKNLNAEKASAINDCKGVLVILYCEKAKAEIEHTNQTTTGKNDLNSAIKLSPDKAAQLILGFARTAIGDKNYAPARIYTEAILNSYSVSTTHKSTANELSRRL